MAERVFKGEKKFYDLCINTPPKSLKSAICSVAFPAWCWIRAPHLKFITTSYSPGLAGRDVRASRLLIVSEWFQTYWKDVFELTTDTNEYLLNNRGGERRTTSPHSNPTGHKADIILADDPNAADDRYSQADRDLVKRWWDEGMWSRLDNQDVGIRIVIQQRIDNQDLTGHIKKQYGTKYRYISLPAELTDGHHPEPIELEKFYIDGLMFPERLSKEILAEARIVQRTAYSGQYNQSPIVVGGRFFKEHWPQWFTKESTPIFDQIIVSVDASFTDAATSCPASLQVWAKKTPNYYMLYDLTTRMGAIETATQLDKLLGLYRGAIAVVENAANGYYVIEKMKMKHSVYQFNPSKFGGKEVRAESISALWETGNVYIHDSVYNRTKYLEEILAFPNSEFKDRVDAMSQALIYFTRCVPRLAEAATIRTY